MQYLLLPVSLPRQTFSNMNGKTWHTVALLQEDAASHDDNMLQGVASHENATAASAASESMQAVQAFHQPR